MPRGGNNKFEPTEANREVVRLTVGRGVPQMDICQKIINPATRAPIDLKTFRKAFAEEIEAGEAEIDDRVKNYLASAATGRRGHGTHSVTAAIFWAKARMLWRDRDKSDAATSGAGGSDGVTQIEVVGGLPERKRM